jgi:hypothetical protein
MGLWALALSSVLYSVVFIDLAMKRKYPLSLIFLCYTIANLGYIWLAYYEKEAQ